MNQLIGMLLVLLLGAVASAEARAYGKSQRYQATVQGLSLAPNAGGQESYSLKLSTNKWEAGVFSNQYLLADNQPLSGAVYAYRFPICGDECFWQFFTQIGGGGSNGGPIMELTWGTIIPLLPIWLPTSAPKYVPALRLDITTHLIFIRWRAVTWSYPLWVGISVPF